MLVPPFILIATLLLGLLPHRGVVVAQGEFDWDITPLDNYPIIGFNQANVGSEVVMKYNYTGTISANKYLEAQVLQADCESTADANAITFAQRIEQGNEFAVDVDVNLNTITSSVHYVPTAGENEASVQFCIR